MSDQPLPAWRRRDAFNPAYQRRLNEAVNASSFVQGEGGIEVLSERNGKTIVNTRERIHTEITFGEILDTGPLGTEDDFTGNQYWVRRKRPIVTGGATVSSIATRRVDTDDEDAADGDKVAKGTGETLEDDTVIVATDAFVDSDVRNYEAEQTVLLLAVDGKVGDGTERAYVIIRPEAGTTGGDSAARVLVTGQRGGGKYDGTLMFAPTSPIDPDTDLGEADLGTASGGEDVILVNLLEVGSSDHLIDPAATPRIFDALPLGVSTEDDKRVFTFVGFQTDSCA